VHRAIHDLWHNSIKNMLDIVLGIWLKKTLFASF
jgi:hypothetical protein